MTLPRTTTILSGIPLFAALPTGGIRFLAKTLQQIELGPQSVLFREGDAGEAFFVVLEGQLEVVKAMGTDEEEVITVRGPGEFIGEMSFFLPSGARTASVRALTRVRLLEMTREHFDTALQKWPAMAVEVSRVLSRRLRDSDNARMREVQQRKSQVSKIFDDLQETLTRLSRQQKPSGFHADESRRLLTEFAAYQQSLLAEKDHAEVDRKALGLKHAIYRSNLPRLYVKTFGGFRVYRDDRPMDDLEWEANQPKLLLKAIVCRGFRGIPKDVLIEDLWPETTTEAGERNFKVILHRLRKCLEPGLVKEYGSSYVHLKTNLVSLDEALCRVDVEEFLILIQRGAAKEAQGDLKSAAALYREALKLRTGDFLAEDLYTPWAEARREELLNRYRDLLFKAAELQEKQGNLKSATDYYLQILRVDPLSEQACQQLMRNYAERGMRTAALKAYERCRKTLLDELDAEPDRLTTALYRKLLESTK